MAEDAYARLARAIADVQARRRPVLFGITGGVAAGKTTTARRVAVQLERIGLVVQVLSTDAFLLPNAELAQRGLDLRKGFPESYDAAALDEALGDLRAGHRVEVPVYSHLTYDRRPGATEVLDPIADVVIVEGVNALQPPGVEQLDLSVYVDADEEHVRTWFLDRFLRLCDEGKDDPSSFYGPLAELARDEQAAVGEAAWSSINVVNLRQHILPTKASATFVLRKAADHRVLSLSSNGKPA